MIRSSYARVRSNIDVGSVTTLAAAIVALAAAYTITQNAGGTHTVFPHLFYVPVLVVALRWGPLVGGGAGIVAGIACGPLMPLDTASGAPQELANWLTRLGFFTGIGILAGGISQRMKHRHERIEQLHKGAISAFVRTIDAKSPYTARHSERVANFAGIAAAALGMSKQRCDDLHWAGLVHDIGKLWIPDCVLNKPGKLSDTEWDLIKEHPVLSEQFLSEVEEFRKYTAAARSHHERYDGTGYPDGLAGEEIPLDGRILAVADAFEAMTAERPYRPPLSITEAVFEIERNSGTQFDPQVAQAFCVAIRDHSPLTSPRRNTHWARALAAKWPLLD